MLSYLLLSNLADRLVFNILGIVVSSYALYVETQKEKNPKYRAMCDFNEHMSCSKALCSEYGKGFGVVGVLLGPKHFLNQRNCTMGILFYLLQIGLAFLPDQGLASLLLYYSSVLAGIGSAYLAYILLFVLRDLCIVCVFTYVINASLIYLNYSLYKQKQFN
ncbi:vitamin K epoxide reductase complex subunit 1-like protein 1 [Gigantopelta aegis]|uniref:vitamin K epoxide reductase complex subunit 1-like protein 1 n=1 Tax=Gigantopelta aegis TaxID=1735272 RepID=UPI001B88BC6E|nr:vitamin K epoxide reductase complex subunit 1-like protein 1 [Gigantopelta aegis]